MVDELVRAGGVRRGPDAGHVLETIATRGAAGGDLDALVPASYWSVLPDETLTEPSHLVLRGAVLLRVLGRAEAETTADTPAPSSSTGRTRAASKLTKLAGATERPFAEMWQLIRGERPSLRRYLAPGSRSRPQVHSSRSCSCGAFWKSAAS